MWRKVFLSALLLLSCLLLSAGSLAGSAAASLPDPMQMTDEEILLELGQHWGQQRLEQDESRKTLLQVLTLVEGSQSDSEMLQVSLGQISRDAKISRELITESIRSWENSSAAAEKELRRLRTQNNILLAGVVLSIIGSLVSIVIVAMP